MAELETIARELESGELGLDESIERYSEGISYARMCQKKLDEAEKRIELLQKSKDGTVQKKKIALDNDTNEVTEDIQGSLL